MPNLIELGYRLLGSGCGLLLFSGLAWLWTRKVRMDRRRRASWPQG
jgi:hypothetical protein